MAATIRILLPLIYAVVVNADNAFDDPFYNIKPFPLSRRSEKSPHEHNIDKFSESHSSNAFSYNSNGNDPFGAYHSMLQGGIDPYFSPFSMGNMGLPMNFGMPGFNNIFNVPGPQGNPKNEAGNNISGDGDKKPADAATAPAKDPKSLENMPPKTNLDNDEAGKGGKDVGIDKKKDYLLMGSGGNGNNNMYLLHENNPIVPTTAQPANVVYVPYQPGPGPQVYQVVATPNNNIPLAPEKQFVNPFSSVVSNLNANNPLNQNNGYILIYFNGQMIQIPGVILNPPQNNAQNPVQGNNVAAPQNPPNTVYTNVPNPGTNTMYVAQPNNGGNNMYVAQPNPGPNQQYVMMPGTNTAQPMNVQPVNQGNPQPGYQPNPPTNVYYQPTMQGNQGNLQNQPNNQYQPMSAPANTGSNGFGQPNMPSNQGNNQGAGPQNPAIAYPAVVLPMDRSGNQGRPMMNAPKNDPAMTPTNIQPAPQPPAPNNNGLDRNTLSNYGAIPAVMIAGYKDDKKDSPGKVDIKANKAENKDEVKIRPT
ncbi:unnamed protein product [Chrysodeixis includens]|uniref:Uncharacterized protein n=1 Tax=Chrysodeixis includens TaxID=689277 RepID=A0A9P0BSA4_CHRIL|nr:unnamed protein product [Chrysodeixis includens]